MLGGIMQTGKNVGMVTMDDALKELVFNGTITAEEALSRAIDPDTMHADFLAASKNKRR